MQLMAGTFGFLMKVAAQGNPTPLSSLMSYVPMLSRSTRSNAKMRDSIQPSCNWLGLHGAQWSRNGCYQDWRHLWYQQWVTWPSYLHLKSPYWAVLHMPSSFHARCETFYLLLGVSSCTSRPVWPWCHAPYPDAYDRWGQSVHKLWTRACTKCEPECTCTKCEPEKSDQIMCIMREHRDIVHKLWIRHRTY